MSKSRSSNGLYLVDLLLVLFIGLKLTGYIDWSWWWVFAPIWMPLIAALVVYLFTVALASLLGGKP